MKITPKFSVTIPEHLEQGFLYISKEYQTASHLCCCGCGNKVVTPLGPLGWKLSVSKHGVTLYPSIGNWSYKCRSHYWITDGEVIWSHQMSEDEILRGRQYDDHERAAYFESRPQDTADIQSSDFVSIKSSTYQKFKKILRRLLGN